MHPNTQLGRAHERPEGSIRAALDQGQGLGQHRGAALGQRLQQQEEQHKGSRWTAQRQSIHNDKSFSPIVTARGSHTDHYQHAQLYERR
jgi:hypothetical protein